MPVLDNAKHELFAQEIAKGSSGRAAYIAAGYEPKSNEVADASASRLLSDERVSARVHEIQEEGGKAAGVTVAELIAQAELARKAAMKNGQASAAVQAIAAKAKLAGVWVDRSKSEFSGLTRHAHEFTNAQLHTIVAGGIETALQAVGLRFLPDGTLEPVEEGQVGGIVYGEREAEAARVIIQRHETRRPAINLQITGPLPPEQG